MGIHAHALRGRHERRQIRYYGRLLELSRYEYGLLRAAGAAARAGSSRATSCWQQVWDDASDSFDRTVDAHVKTLRAKLKAVAPDVEPIRTLRGTGYALSEDLPRRHDRQPTLTRRTRIFLGILLIYAAGTAFLLYRVVAPTSTRATANRPRSRWSRPRSCWPAWSSRT